MKVVPIPDPDIPVRVNTSPAPINYAPTREYLESIWGNVTRYGTKVMADGRQWVIHGKTGEPFERQQGYAILAKHLGKEAFIWLKKGEELSALDEPMVSIWKNPGD